MTRTRKWLVGGGALIGVLLVAIAIGLAWLLYTPAGLRFALDRTVALTHGGFTYKSATGTLAGETTITGLDYRSAGGDTLQVEHATLQLQPSALLGGRLHVHQARIDGITLDLAPAKPSSATGGLSLQPPLTIALDDTRLTQISVRQSGTQTFAADSLALAGLWSRDSLVVRKLALRAPAGSINLEGTLARGHRGHASATVDWQHDHTRYTGTINAQSDGKAATLHAAVSAPARAVLDLSLQLDAKRVWRLTVQVPTFDTQPLAVLPASLHTLALDLRGTGNAHGGTLHGTLAANGHAVLLDPVKFAYAGKTLTLDQLRLRSPAMPGVASATGVVQLATTPMTAALNVQWQAVQLPADLVGQPLATHGTVHLAGSTEGFALQGKLAAGPPGKLANLQVDLTGTPQAIQLKALQLVQANGGLDMHGRVGLKPQINWTLTAVAKRFDPGAILAGWNGALDFTLATQGRMTPQGPNATFKLTNAGGTLRGRSVAGSKANLKITPNNLLDGTLLLVAGNSQIRAQGTSGARTNATLELDIAGLNDWMPQAAGQLHGHFAIRGAWPKLAVAGRLDGKALDVAGQRIDALQLTASIPDLRKPGGDLELSLDGVHASGLDFDRVHVTGHGTATAHHVALKAHGPSLDVALTLQGSWRASAKRWTGTLRDAVLSPTGMPTWQQQQPTAITWQNNALTLAQFCLSAGAPQLCLSGKRDARGVVTAEYNLQALPLQLLATLASGVHPLEASGEVSGSGQITLAASGALRGHASLAASAGHIAFAATANQPLLAWSSITLDATASGADQHVTLNGALADGGHIEGTIDIHGNARALGGHVAIDLRNLAFLSALSREIANVKGSVTGGLQFGGTLTAPQFTGRIQTQGFSAELPRAGLKLHDGSIAIANDAQGHLAITGQITSGTGVLHIKGSTGLAANAPLTLDLEGDNVLVADIPAAHVLASPRLHIDRNNGTYALTGTVTIPNAQVKVEELPGQGPTKASPDIVILDAPPPQPVTPLAMQANLQIVLGDHVKVQGYGFDGSVHGQLAAHVRPGHVATGRGEIRINGKYQAYGQDLTIHQGRVLFAGTRLDNPGLDIRAVREIRSQDVSVGLNIRGTAQRPVLTLFSDPAMQQTEALSYLVTGRSLDTLRSGEGDALDSAAQALGGLAGNRLASAVGSRLGLEAGVTNSDVLGGSAFTAGKYLSPRLFLSYGVGLFTPGQIITLRYTLNRFLQFEAENATTGNRANLNYKIEK